MSQDDVEIVRRLFDAATGRDTEAVLALYHPDFEWDGSRHRWVEVMGASRTSFRGHEGLRQWSRDYHEMWEYLEDELEELIDAGEHVVSVVTTRARGRSSGIEVEWKHNAGVWTLRNGKVVRVVWFPSPDEALEFAGLSD
jgi:ketosteroid isomerase-like protein